MMIHYMKINRQIDQQCANNGKKRMHAISKEENQWMEAVKHKHQQYETTSKISPEREAW